MPVIILTEHSNGKLMVMSMPPDTENDVLRAKVQAAKNKALGLFRRFFESTFASKKRTIFTVNVEEVSLAPI
jgi:hypothetical protein